MEHNKNILSEVEKTLNSLDDFKKVEADAFFFTRLSSRMEKQEEKMVLSWLFNTPLLKPALVILAVFINILSIGYVYFGNENIIETEFAEVLNTEYMLDHSTESYLVLNE